MKKLLALLIALLMILSVLASCGDKPTDASSESASEATSDTSSDTASDTDSSDSDSEPDAKEYVVLFEKNVESEYQIIYAPEITSSSKTAVGSLTARIADKFNIFLKEMALSGSFDIVQEKEILIGNTGRPESIEAAKLLSSGNGYTYAIKLFENGKLAIVATNETSLARAVIDFMVTYVDNGEADRLALEKGFEAVVDISDSVNVRWRLTNIPEYEGGTLAGGVYLTGANLSGSGTSGNMHIISKTNMDEFNSYLDTLKNEGFNEIATNEINGNKYVQFTNPKGTQTVYTYYIASLGEVRIINDTVSTPESLTEYTYEPKEGEYAAIYQFAMMYDPTAGGSGDTSDGKYPNNGNFIIIKLSDNKLILIDGGGSEQATDKATEALIDFFYEITGKDRAAGDKITIAAWHLTHNHGDHYMFASKLFKNHSDIIELERVIHNIPTGSSSNGLSTMSQAIISNYPARHFIKCHTGQSIQLGDVTIDVLLTHEDLTNPETSSSLIMESNDQSTILKFTFSDGRTFISLGDWGGDWSSIDEPAVNARYRENEERFLSMYRDENGKYPFLEADVVQVSHHAINDWMNNIYKAISPDYAFIPQADVAYNLYRGSCFRKVIDQLKATGTLEENIFHANRITHGLLFKDGAIEHTMQGITGYDESYYYYTDASGNKLYTDADGNVTTTAAGNTLITDSDGAQVFDGFDDAKAVYVKGYMDYINAEDSNGNLKYPPYYTFNT